MSKMHRKLLGLLMLMAVLAVGACHDPYPLVYYPAPAPPPLQPYAGPAVAVAVAPATKRIVKRRYVRRHYRARCRCTPAS